MALDQNMSAVLPEQKHKKAAFFDRDGIINVDHGYVHTIEQFEFVDGVLELLQSVQSKGYDIVIVTNQSGIARGMYSEDDFKRLSHWMCEQLKVQGVLVSQVYFCPHHPTAGHTALTQACTCRKPHPGMLLNAAEENQYNLSQSIMIGDKYSDMECAVNAELRAGYWLITSNLASTTPQKPFIQLVARSQKTELVQVTSLRECIYLI